MPFFNKELFSKHKKESNKEIVFSKKDLIKIRLCTKQENFCVSLLQKSKKKHSANLNYKGVADSNEFWRTVKLLSGKSKSNEKKALVQGNKIISEDKGNVELLNSFFSNAIKHFKFPKGSDSNPLAEFISHPIFKAMLKYKNHPSIIAIKNTRNGSGFSFCAYSY